MNAAEDFFAELASSPASETGSNSSRRGRPARSGGGVTSAATCTLSTSTRNASTSMSNRAPSDDEVPVLRELAPGHLVSCHWAEEIRDGVLEPKSPEEVAATQGVTVRATGVGAIESDALVQGLDEPVERR